MPETERILAEFGIPIDQANGCSDEVRRILIRLVDAGAISVGELQSARDIISRSPGTDERAYLLIAAMFIALHSGEASLALSGDPVADAGILADAGRIDRRTEEPAPGADEFSNLVIRHWTAAVAAIPSLDRFVVAHESDGVRHLYFQRYFSATEHVREQFSIRQNAQADIDGRKLAPPSEAFSYSRNNIVLLAEQRRAVESAVANRLAVITGGPGTGKTTIVCSILRALIRLENLTASDIALAAPTGRAAQRMGEALRKQCLSADERELPPAEREQLNSLSGTTIHTLLGGRPSHWRHDASNPLPQRLVVIDEASMVDLLLMSALLDALRPDCRLVLLGDANQLPPVQAGAVLGCLAPRGVELTESRRFTGSLKTCADEFQRGETSTIFSSASRFVGNVASVLESSATQNTCQWREADDPKKEVDAFLREWADANGLGKNGELTLLAQKIRVGNAAFCGEMTPEAKDLFEKLDASRILTVVRNGPYGSVRANENLLRNRLGRLPFSRRLVAPGIPIIVTANTSSVGLFNGDVGVTVEENGVMFAMFPRGDKVVACPVSRLPEHDLAYAITVHKSQGSEYGNVLAILPDTPGHPLLTRRMVYTAITRARHRSVIFSSRRALSSAAEKFASGTFFTRRPDFMV